MVFRSCLNLFMPIVGVLCIAHKKSEIENMLAKLLSD